MRQTSNLEISGCTNPILTIDLPKLRDNARVEKKELGEHGIEVMAVNKVFNGCVATARAVLEGGIDVIAESRTYNLKKLKDASGVVPACCAVLC